MSLHFSLQLKGCVLFCMCSEIFLTFLDYKTPLNLRAGQKCITIIPHFSKIEIQVRAD